MRVLLTSFQPFDGREGNSSHQVASVLAKQPPAGITVDWLSLPVVMDACVVPVRRQVAAAPPDLVLSLGQAAGSPWVRIEDRGANLHDFTIPDNAGHQPRQQAIVPGAPAYYRTTAPLPHILLRLRQRGQSCEHSFTAGRYVCNHLYFHLLHHARTTQASHQTLFVHVPLLPTQLRPSEKTPTLPLAQIVECVREIILACGGQ